MTVSSIIPVNNYSGNGSNTIFDFDFLIENQSELVVKLIKKDNEEITLINGIDYTIHEIGNKNGSYITFPLENSSYEKLQTGEILSLSLNLEIKQESEFKNSSHLKLDVLEWTFDYIIRILQILNRKTERSIKTQEGLNIDSENLINKINIVSSNLDNIESVVQAKENIDIAATNINPINNVAEIINSVNCVSENINNIANVSGSITSVNSVAEISSNIVDVSNKISNINTVANNINKIDPVSENISDINTVSNNIENINNVSQNIDIIDDFTENIDFVNQSKSVLTGSISDNIIIYSDIHNYNHSTFDLSKFTINGSPIVTDDGVMYGAGVGNNASFKCGLVNYTQPNFVISCGFIMDDDTSFGRALIGYQVSNYSWGIIINGSIVRGFLSSDGTSWDIGNLTGTTTLVSGHHYVVYLVRENGQKYILYLLDKTTSTLTKEAEITSSADIHNTNQTVANVGRLSGWNSAAPTIDLKEISFNFGSSVINANKNGLDVIKDDNYTVVGTPTISTDGIMSNMSASNYASFTTGATVSKSNQLKIKARITTASSFSKNGRFIGCGTNLFFGHTASGALSVSFLGTNIPTSISLQPLTMYDAEFIYDGTYLYGTATNVITGDTSISNKVEVTSENTVTLNGYIGNDTANTNAYLIGSLDLNSIEIYVNGNLIYQPCLKIPYNISKTGSKVVDVYARNRVQSMYEQFGYAPYYTINEANQNFTLPMGEVYGMIQGMIQKLSDSTTSMITPDYANGITISGGANYTVPKDGWISYVPVNNTDTSVSVDKVIAGYIAIAGKTVLQSVFAYGEDTSHPDSGFFMISKGQTVYHNMSSGTVYFYPCKGGIN